MSAPVLIINGIELPQRSRLDFQQTFQRLDGGFSMRRKASGAAFSMARWERWSTMITGGGWVPPTLMSLQRGVPFAIHCVAPIALRPAESLPSGWTARTDWPEVSMTDENGVTVRLVYPIVTMITTDGVRLVTGGAEPQWELACEEP